jgi:putative membrane protein
MMIGFGGFGLLFMLLFWGAVIVLAVWAFSAHWPVTGREVGPANQNLTARQIADLRYARGELSRAQYEQMKQDLNG